MHVVDGVEDDGMLKVLSFWRKPDVEVVTEALRTRLGIVSIFFTYLVACYQFSLRLCIFKTNLKKYVDTRLGNWLECGLFM